MVAVNTIWNSKTVHYSFMQCHGSYNNIEHVHICLMGRGRAIASPRAMPWSVGFPWEKGVHDSEVVGKIYGNKFNFGILHWEFMMSKDWAKFRWRHVIK